MKGFKKYALMRTANTTVYLWAVDLTGEVEYPLWDHISKTAWKPTNGNNCVYSVIRNVTSGNMIVMQKTAKTTLKNENLNIFIYITIFFVPE